MLADVLAVGIERRDGRPLASVHHDDVSVVSDKLGRTSVGESELGHFIGTLEIAVGGTSSRAAASAHESEGTVAEKGLVVVGVYFVQRGSAGLEVCAGFPAASATHLPLAIGFAHVEELVDRGAAVPPSNKPHHAVLAVEEVCIDDNRSISPAQSLRLGRERTDLGNRDCFV